MLKSENVSIEVARLKGWKEKNECTRFYLVMNSTTKDGDGRGLCVSNETGSTISNDCSVVWNRAMYKFERKRKKQQTFSYPTW